MSNAKIPFWKRGDKRSESARTTRQAELEQRRAEMRGTLDLAFEIAGSAEMALAEQLADNASFLAGLGRHDRAEYQSWNAEAWRVWTPDPADTLAELRVGSAHDEGLDQELGLPLIVEVHGPATAPIVVTSDEPTTQLPAALSLLGSLTARAALCFPKQAHFTLLDPARRGATFPFSRWIDRVALGFEDVSFVLEELLTDIARIESTYLGDEVRSFAELPSHLLLGEHPQFLVVASFPKAYDDEQQALIREACARGGAAGVQVILHLEGTEAVSASELLDAEPALAGATVLDIAGTEVHVDGVDVVIHFDELPAAATQQMLFQRLATTARRDPLIDWSAARPDEAAWWSTPADEVVSFPIGTIAGDELRDVWFGTDPQLGRSCRHGLLLGGPAARAHTFDLLLAGAATQYSPSALHLRLIDADDHAVLSGWAQLPHTELSALRPSPGQARAALAGLVELAEHRRGSGEYLPRVLGLVADLARLADGADAEIDAQRPAALLARLAACGDVGVHVVFGANDAAAAHAVLGADAIDELDLRLAVGEQAAKDQLALVFPAPGDALAQRVCDRPGRALMNTLKGAPSINLALRLMVVSPELRDELVETARELARTSGEKLPRRLVLNGADHPDLTDDPMLNALIANRNDPAALQDVLRDGWNDGSQTIEAWGSNDVPRFAPLGRSRATVQGVASSSGFVLRRGAAENVLVVMAERELRSGVTTSVMLGTGLSTAEADTELWIADRAAPGTPAGDAVRAAIETLEPAGVAVELANSAETAARMIARLAAEMERRLGLDDAAQTRQSTILFVLGEPDRISLLHRVPTSTGSLADSALGATLRSVLSAGPVVGIHTLVATPSVASAKSVIDDGALHHLFRHRVVTRLGDEDSFAVVRSGRAAELEHHPDRPAPAVLFDSVDHRIVEFTPYSTAAEATSGTSFVAQIAELAEAGHRTPR